MPNLSTILFHINILPQILDKLPIVDTIVLSFTSWQASKLIYKMLKNNDSKGVPKLRNYYFYHKTIHRLSGIEAVEESVVLVKNTLEMLSMPAHMFAIVITEHTGQPDIIKYTTNGDILYTERCIVPTVFNTRQVIYIISTLRKSYKIDYRIPHLSELLLGNHSLQIYHLPWGCSGVGSSPIDETGLVVFDCRFGQAYPTRAIERLANKNVKLLIIY